MMEIEQETVYGTHEDSHVVMSEKVQSLAGSIYQEFEKMIAKYDEDVVKDLMPLVVNVLECLDLSYTENQEHEVELELLREDNEQLVTQYEREKQLRKTSEQKLLELEDAGEDERKDLHGQIESLESILRMLELKSKNSSDHVCRLEEKEQEQKREYAKLHERYTELFKTHMDYMERVKIIMGNTERLEGVARGRLPQVNLAQLNRSSGPVSFGFTSLEAGLRSVTSPGEYVGSTSPPDSNHSNTSLRNELQETQLGSESSRVVDEQHNKNRETSEKGQLTDTISTEHRGTVTRGGWVDGFSPDTKESTPELEDVEALMTTIVSPIGRSKTKKEQRSGNTLYQELSFQDAEALVEMDEGADITGSWVHPGEYASSVNDNFFGMGKEVENLIMENNELLATKNALNIVKDDLIVKVDELTSEQEILREEIKSLYAVRGRLGQRIQELEEELKRVREEAERTAKASKSDDEQEDVPMAQRKRFTRVEMARVLMERNQYKERFMELQEAVRWTEMIRASRNDPTLDKKSKQSIWKFFSNLFSATERPQRKPLPYVNVRYSAPTHLVSPALDTMRKRSLNDRKRGLDFMDGELSSEKLAARRATERREQYRQVRAHVRKDDGRLQAYGWSLPAKVPGSAGSVAQTPPTSNAGRQLTTSTNQVPVPVPVYCRPLNEKEPGMKIWCAAGVNLQGGRTRDGGNLVGASVFYTTSRPEGMEKGEGEMPEKTTGSEVDDLDQELRKGEKLCRESQELERQLSSLVWICTSTHAASKVTVIDANNPADILESFSVCSSYLLCIASVPGAQEGDYSESDMEVNNKEMTEQQEKEVSCVSAENEVEDADSGDHEPNIGKISFVSCATGSSHPTSDASTNRDRDSMETAPPSWHLVKDITAVDRDGLSQLSKENELCEEAEKMSSVLPTMWLGSQNGHIYVHSGVSQWHRCLHSVRLKDSVLSIVHVSGRVLVALADGSVAIFCRGPDGQWDLGSYHLVDLGLPHHSIRCMVAVYGRVWCGYRNKIHVLHPRSLQVEKSLDAHPRRESQVRQMAWLGDGVWVSIRLDSTLRLYHAHTYQHLQDVDIEPYVSKMLGTGKLGFSFVRITALLISSSRLWIGTGNGVIISVPLSESAGTRSNSSNLQGMHRNMPGGVVRVYADSSGSRVTPGSFIPYCSMAQAQLSFHGHRDAVKFFVAIPGSGGLSAAMSDAPLLQNVELEALERKKPASMLVMSGGEGYIDFRIGDGEEDELEGETEPMGSSQQQDRELRGERSHLIVWQVAMQD
ncbi:JNK-interacting protein 3 isoform X3 [Zootermopsis nevadensis]|uniref:JNK-interacting protein 3 n=1 Tax=Zootermopsis nevadensis TaxID=136037 RepID=A0A067R954_ZOONE|nr:JNK-interacting protein 3 isoform X3 [Zootermopsis nevadensis]KDR19135.1 C-jun-amino-terminal kinase-interacting protein 3 [Zootermopsis nevadensis]